MSKQQVPLLRDSTHVTRSLLPLVTKMRTSWMLLGSFDCQNKSANFGDTFSIHSLHLQ